MSEFSIQAFEPGQGRDMLQSLIDAARDYRDDPDFRARLEADPRGELAARNLRIEPEDAEVQLHVNTPDVFHMVLAADPNAAMSDQSLSAVAGGSSASSAGSVGSAGTVSTTPSCFGCVSSVLSAGSAGSASANS